MASKQPVPVTPEKVRVPNSANHDPLSEQQKPLVEQTPQQLRLNSGLAQNTTRAANDSTVKRDIEQSSMIDHLEISSITGAMLSNEDRAQLSVIFSGLPQAAWTATLMGQISNASNETAMYAPLGKLINGIIDIVCNCEIEGLAERVRFKYLPLGNKVLGGSKSRRKPDGVFVETQLFDEFNKAWQEEGLVGLDVAKMERRAGLIALEEEDGAGQDYATMKPRRNALRGSDALPDDPPNPGASLGHVPVPPITPDQHEKVKQAHRIVDSKLLWQSVAFALEVKKSSSRSAAAGGLAHSSNLSSKVNSASTPISTSSQLSVVSSSKRPHHEDGSVATPSSKRSKTSSVSAYATDQDVQMVNYLAEMRSALGHRSHAIGIWVRRTDVQVFFADPCGNVRSETINMDTDLIKFALLIAGMAMADNECVGINQRFEPPRDSKHPKLRHPLPTELAEWSFNYANDLNGEGKLAMITDTITVQWGCFGRGTAVFEIDGAKWDVKRAVLKRSHPFSARPPEYDLLEAARKILGDGGVVEVFDHGEGEFVSNGFRLKLGLGVRSDRREVYIIMELVVPLYSFPMVKYIGPFLEILDSHHKLCDKGLLHRDISSTNLMYRPQPSKRLPKQGVLIDLDLSVDKNSLARDYDETLTHRTGTLPFLAVAILKGTGENPPTHLPRFDLESFLYVFIWLAICYPNGKVATYAFEKHPLKNWLSVDLGINAAAKRELSYRFQRSSAGAESFERLNLPELNLCIKPLRKLCRELMDGEALLTDFKERLAEDPAAKGTYTHPDGRVEEASWERANETLLGRFTYETVKNTFISIEQALVESFPV